ncbi:MAG: beta-ketoacyl synthase N-terminal-like domain-containing protein, partial [Dehalococcoidia bacterium]
MSEQLHEPIRVVVTGVGAVTAQGPSADDFWEGVKAGRVAIRPVQRIPMDGFRTRLAGEVQQIPVPEHEYRHPEEFRDPVFDFAMKAAEEAMESSGVDTVTVPAERWGVVIGTCNAGLISGRQWYIGRMAEETPNPDRLMLTPPHALAEALSGAFGLKGPALSIDT